MDTCCCIADCFFIIRIPLGLGLGFATVFAFEEGEALFKSGGDDDEELGFNGL